MARGSSKEEALFKEAETAFNGNNWQKALTLYEELSSKMPDDEVVVYNLSKLYAIKGKIRLFIDQRLRLVDILCKKSRQQDALRVIQNLLTIQPENINIRMKLILIFKQLGRREAVVQESLNLARLLIDVGKGEQSIQLLLKAQEEDPDNIKIALELAQMYVSYGHIQEGANQYRRIANKSLSEQKFEEAATAFKRLKLLEAQDQELIFTLGNIYVKLNKLEEAETEFRTILRLNLSHIGALKALGKVCYRLEHLRDAILAFSKVVSIDPDDLEAYERLALIYYGQGDKDKAVNFIINAAEKAKASNNNEKAVELYRKVLYIVEDQPLACKELTNMGAPVEPIEFKIEEDEVFASLETQTAPQEKPITAVISPTQSSDIIAMPPPPQKADTIAMPPPQQGEDEIRPEKEEQIPSYSVKTEDKAVCQPPKEEIIAPSLVEYDSDKQTTQFENEFVTPQVTGKPVKQEVISVPLKKEPEHITKPQKIDKANEEPALIQPKEEQRFEFAFVDNSKSQEKLQSGLIRDHEGKTQAEGLISKDEKLERITGGKIEHMKDGGLIKPEIIVSSNLLLDNSKLPGSKETKIGAISEIRPIIETKIIETEEAEETVLNNKTEEKVDENINEISPKVEGVDSEPQYSFENLDEVINEGKWEIAIKLLGNYIGENDKDLERVLQLGKIYLDLNEIEMAVDLFKNLLEKNLDREDLHFDIIQSYLWSEKYEGLVELLVAIFNYYCEKEDFVKAMDIGLNILLFNIEHVDTRSKVAQILWDTDKKDESVFHYNFLIDLLIEQRDFSLAQEILTTVLEKTGDLRIQERLADVFLMNNAFSEAIEMYLEIARYYEENDKTQESIGLYNKVIQANPESIEALFGLISIYSKAENFEELINAKTKMARIFSKQQKFSEAIEIYEEVLSLNSSLQDIKEELLKILLIFGDEEKARTYTVELGEKLAQDENYQGSISVYKEYLNKYPLETAIREKLTKCYLLGEDLEKARKELLSLAESFKEQNLWERVVNTLEKVLELSPDVDTILELADIYELKLNKPENAMQFLQKAMNEKPDEPKIFGKILKAYLKSGSYENAEEYLKLVKKDETRFSPLISSLIEDYKNKIQLNPNDFKSTFELGIVYRSLSLLDEAIEQFQQSKKVNDYLLASYNMLGMCFSEKRGFGMFDLAIKQFKKGMEVKGFDEHDYQGLRYNLAKLYETRNMIQEALKYYQDIYAVDINYKDVNIKIGKLGKDISDKLINTD